MPRIKKKGTSGQAKNFITRTQAVRKLQISLPDFRRLCIFKGIYPREPRNKRKASKTSTQATTFYYTKDIQYLLHEPLLAKFRDHKALGKKITRALGRNEISNAQRLERNLTPRMTLDHVIKERYPTFVDALRDLDDALSMLCLFANLPQTDTVPPKTIALCQRLTLEFEHYIIRTHSLRKSFLSIKGIYYKAEIQGQDILWLVPYKFVQRVTGDIDFRIMGTFVEFYTTLLGFVNYRLYTGIGLVYPPTFDTQSDNRGGELGAFRLEGKSIGQQESAGGERPNGVAQIASASAQAEADKLQVEPAPPAEAPDGLNVENEVDDGEIETFQSIDPSADTLLQPSMSTSAIASLFQDTTFFLSRETPRHPLEFILRAFGCRRVGWDAVLGDGAYLTDERDKRITHQVVDRPNLPLPEIPEDVQDEHDGRLKPGERVVGRTYVQPQWVWDCINAGKVLRPDLYAPGADLPPHLSPFVKAKKGQYDPTKSLEEQEVDGEAEIAAELDAEEEANAAEAADDDESMDDDDDDTKDSGKLQRQGTNALLDSGDIETGEGMDIELAASDEEEDDEESEAAEPNGEWGGLDSDEESDAGGDANLRHQRELQAEASGVTSDAGSTPGKAVKQAAQKKRDRERREKDEEVERQKMMLSKRKRKLFEKMTYSNNKKDEEAEKLRSKRRKHEKLAGKQGGAAA